MKQIIKLSLTTFLVLTTNHILYAGDEGASSPYTVLYGAYTGANNRGYYNSFIGRWSGYRNTTGKQNTFLGYRSGQNNTDGDSNTFLGYRSGQNNTDGDSNTFIGYKSGYANISTGYNTFIGGESGLTNTTGQFNTLIGAQSGYKNSTGSNNTFIGEESGYNNTSGEDNTFNGYLSGLLTTTGNGNTFNGSASGMSNTTGQNNTFTGGASGANATVNDSVFLGYRAGYSASRDNTLYISNTKTNSPLIYGEFDTPIVVINGELNTTKPISTNINVNNNSSLQSAFSIRANNTNTDQKSDVGFVLGNTREAFSWTFRTFEPDNSFAISKQNSGAKELRIIGLDEPNGMELILGNGARNTGGQWLDASSRKYKENIQTLDSKTAMKAFHKLEPVTYNYKTNKTEPIVGFIAEDVPDVVATNKRDALSALEIVALLTKVVQIQEDTSKKKDIKLHNLEEKIIRIEALISDLKKSSRNSK
jgi:hypothetical protein